MTLAETIQAMLAAGCSAEQIAEVVKVMDEARRAKARDGNRQRQASFRARHNVNNGVTGRDGPLVAVTGRDGPLPRAPAPSRVLYGEVREEIPPVDATHRQPPGADERKRGARVTTDWKPSAAHEAEAVKLGLTSADLGTIAEEFVNFWRSEAGAKARKLDWGLTFLNRMRDQAPRFTRRKSNGNHVHATRPTQGSAHRAFQGIANGNLDQPDLLNGKPSPAAGDGPVFEGEIVHRD